MHNGCVFVFPFLAIMEVHEDFFVYKSGIYRHTDVNSRKPSQYRKHATHNTIRRAICRCQLKLYHAKRKPYVNMVQKRHRSPCGPRLI